MFSFSLKTLARPFSLSLSLQKQKNTPSLALIGVFLAYYFIVNRDVNKYAHDAYPLIPAEKTVVQYPGWSWYLGAASGLLWLLAGCIGCCMPARTKKVTTVV